MKVKVLTLKQPWAELVKEKVKFIETRSWKTNYRGTLYIHAGKSSIDKNLLRIPEILNFVDVTKCQYGAIILKCNLIDCIYMDKPFIDKVKEKNKEFICGRYEIGRYAWVLSDIEAITPIYVGGRQGLWYYDM